MPATCLLVFPKNPRTAHHPQIWEKGGQIGTGLGEESFGLGLLSHIFIINCVKWRTAIKQRVHAHANFATRDVRDNMQYFAKGGRNSQNQGMREGNKYVTNMQMNIHYSLTQIFPRSLALVLGKLTDKTNNERNRERHVRRSSFEDEPELPHDSSTSRR